jgi:hypothetical protein
MKLVDYLQTIGQTDNPAWVWGLWFTTILGFITAAGVAGISYIVKRRK